MPRSLTTQQLTCAVILKTPIKQWLPESAAYLAWATSPWPSSEELTRWCKISALVLAISRKITVEDSRTWLPTAET